MNDLEQSTYDELAREDAFCRKARRHRWQHPDPRDPEHDAAYIAGRYVRLDQRNDDDRQRT